MAKIVRHETVKNPSTLTHERLIADVRTMAKQANQRLVRLERAGKDNTAAYQRAHDYLFGLERARFKETSKNLTRQELVREYRALDKFLSMKTSTVKGANDIEKQKAKTFSEHYGLKIKTKKDVKRYADLWDRLGSKQLKNLFGSDTIAKIIKTVVSSSVSVEKIGTAIEQIERSAMAGSSKSVFSQRDLAGMANAAISKMK